MAFLKALSGETGGTPKRRRSFRNKCGASVCVCQAPQADRLRREPNPVTVTDTHAWTCRMTKRRRGFMPTSNAATPPPRFKSLRSSALIRFSRPVRPRRASWNTSSSCERRNTRNNCVAANLYRAETFLRLPGTSDEPHPSPKGQDGICTHHDRGEAAVFIHCAKKPPPRKPWCRCSPERGSGTQQSACNLFRFRSSNKTHPAGNSRMGR